MELIEITMTNCLVSNHYWNDLILIDSMILFQLKPGIKIYIPLLYEVNSFYLPFYSLFRSVSCSTHRSTISDLNLNSDPFSDATLVVYTLGSWYIDEK